MLPRRRRSCRGHAAGALRLLVTALLAVCCLHDGALALPASAAAASATSGSSGPPTSYGLTVISGNGFRAFSNRFRRLLKRVECLPFHRAPVPRRG
ncbi:hypothetical protein ATCC90586_010598 [Pythium insidiosum]|nr:hypothetical protein ATCC90586_010598 [Pythium insidiosum]